MTAMELCHRHEMVVAIITLLTISCGFGFQVEPPLCGKSVIINVRSAERLSLAADTGTDTDQHPAQDFLPFVASVQRFDASSNGEGNIFDTRLSGAFVGTILGPTVVLVACRCVAKRMGLVGDDEQSTWDARQFGVMAGTPWDYSPVAGTVGQIRFASRIVVHPKCELRPSLYLWDLAVMVLASPFEFSENRVEAALIPMAEEMDYYMGLATSQKLSCFTASWGWAFNSHKPEYLNLKLHPLFVQPLARCHEPFNGDAAAHDVPADMHLCVETAASFHRLWKTGDVGSPLLGFLGANETTMAVQYVVLGIKSEENDATTDGFALFTRLDVDLNWLWSMRENPPEARHDTAGARNIPLFRTLLVVCSAKTLNIY